MATVSRNLDPVAGSYFVERLRKTDPLHAAYYCDHGEYVGHNGFREVSALCCA